MDYLDQIIGFLIIFVIIFFPIIRRMLLAKAQKKAAEKPPPPEIQKEIEAEMQLREHVAHLPPLKSEPKISLPPVPERTVGNGFAFHSALEEYKKRTAIERRRLESRIKPKFRKSIVSNALAPEEQAPQKKITRLERIFSGPTSLKKMVVLQEIFKKPKGL